MSKLTLFLILFIPFAEATYSQNKGDSLKMKWQNEKEPDSIRFKTINDYYTIYQYAEMDSALNVTDFHYKLSKEKKSIKEMAKALNTKANIYLEKDDLDKSLQYYNEAAELAQQLESPIYLATIKGNIGNIFFYHKNYQKATQYYSDALKVFQEQNNEEEESRILINLGNIYNIIGNYDLALEYYNKSIAIYDKLGISNRNIAGIHINIAGLYFKQEKFAEALIPYEEALNFFVLENEKINVSKCYYYLARTHYKLGELDQAYTNIEKSIEISKALNLQSQLLESELLVAEITFETDVEKARIQAESILAQTSSEESNNVKKQIYELLYKCYKAENKMGLALKMYEQKTIYSDSVEKQKNKFAVVREAVKNDFDIQLYETKLENEKAQANLKLKQLKRTFGIIAGSALLIACIIFYFKKNIRKNRKKRDALLEEIKNLKNNSSTNLVVDSNEFQLVREEIEASINRKLNETDWNVLNILLEEPEITNKDIAERAYMSVDGIGSSLRRMYEYFNIKDSKYKKISLLTDAIKRSNK